MNLTFKKLGLSPEDISNMEKFGLPLNKRTKKTLQKIYQETNIAQIDEIRDFEKVIGFSLPEEYIKFLLTKNGGIPSKNLVSKNIIISYFLSLDSTHNDYSIINQYNKFIQFGIPIAETPNGDYLLLSKEGNILLYEHEIFSRNRNELMVIANSFSELLNALH